MILIRPGLGIIVVAFFCGAAAMAQPTGLYAVKDVAENDILNVRSGAGASFRDLGDIAHDGRVQVLGFNGDATWAKVVWGAGTAWVSARFLQRVHVEAAAQVNVMPAGLRCSGAEPFWSAALDPDTITFAMMGQPKSSAAVEWALPASGRPADYIFGFAAGPLTGALLKQACSDGMSDISHPWSIVLINRADDGPVVVEGCCNP